MDYDIVIIGLGPAGSTLAAHLPENMRVCAIDKKSDSVQGFKKPCGGLLAPDAQKFFAGLDLTLPKNVLVDPQIFSVRTIDFDSGLTRYYQRFYLNLDRDRFDKWLISQIPPHINILSACRCTGVSRIEGGFSVKYIGADGKPGEITSRLIIGADGAGSLVRRTMFPGKTIRKYTAIQQWFEDNNSTPFYSSVFDSRITDCYSWTLSKDGCFIFGGAYPQKDCANLFEEQKQRLSEKGFVFGTPLRTEACVVYRPSRMRDFVTARDGAFLIGEAAGFISPSSLEGISYGMKSGFALAEVFCRSSAHPEHLYRKKTLGIRLNLMLKLIKCPFMYNPFLRGLVMKSGLTSVELQSTRSAR